MRRHRTHILLALAACLVLVASACGGGGSSSSLGSGDVANVNGTAVTKAQVTTLLGQAKKSYESQKQKFPTPGSTQYIDLQQRAVAYLVRRAEFGQEAKKLGVSVSQADIDARLKQVKQQYFGDGKGGVDEAKYTKAIAAQGLTDADVRDQLSADLLAQKVYDAVTKDIKVTTAAALAYYKANPKQYTQPESRVVRHILVKDKALADKLYQQIQGGADFATLAKKYSIDTGSAKLGGQLTDTKGQFVPQFEKVAFALKTGQVSQPVKSQYGWHVIKADGPVQASKSTPFDQVKASIEQSLLSQQKNAYITKWLSDLEKQYKPKVTYAPGWAPATGATSTG